MKKVILALGCIALFGLSSCKKDYTCTCTTEVEGMDPQTQSLPIEDAKKGEAEDACNALEVSEAVTCELD